MMLRSENLSAVATAKAEGEDIGLKKGIEKGLKKGREEGREESLTNVVIKGKREGFSLEQISIFTGLSHEKIAEILANNGLN
jgi:flagellar biosynthesis/type III secretory pathway protein FliH